MRTLDRYIAGSFVRNLALACLALTLIYVLQSFLAELVDHEFPAGQVLTHTLLGVPAVLVQMIPPAILMATVLTLSTLNRNNELMACHSIGIGLGRIALLLLTISFMVSCLTVFMQDRILPPVFKKRTNYYWRDMKKRTDFFLDVKQDKIWYRSKNLIYNLQSFDPKSKTIRGMSVYTFDDRFDLKQVVDAERASYTPSGWVLRNGTVTVFAADQSFPLTRKFDEKSLAIAERPADFQGIEREVDGLRLKELWQYIERTRAAGTDTKRFEVTFHSRLSLSFIPLVMCVLGIPFSTRNRRQGGMVRDMGLCLGITFFYWLFHSIGLSLGTNGAVPPILAAWLPSVVFAMFAGFLVLRRQQNG